MCVGFTQAEQAVLVEILVASVRQASEGPALPGRSGVKKVEREICSHVPHHFLHTFSVIVLYNHINVNVPGNERQREEKSD